MLIATGTARHLPSWRTHVVDLMQVVWWVWTHTSNCCSPNQVVRRGIYNRGQRQLQRKTESIAKNQARYLMHCITGALPVLLIFFHSPCAVLCYSDALRQCSHPASQQGENKQHFKSSLKRYGRMLHIVKDEARLPSKRRLAHFHITACFFFLFGTLLYCTILVHSILGTALRRGSRG